MKRRSRRESSGPGGGGGSEAAGRPPTEGRLCGLEGAAPRRSEDDGDAAVAPSDGSDLKSDVSEDEAIPSSPPTAVLTDEAATAIGSDPFCCKEGASAIIVDVFALFAAGPSKSSSSVARRPTPRSLHSSKNRPSALSKPVSPSMSSPAVCPRASSRWLEAKVCCIAGLVTSSV